MFCGAMNVRAAPVQMLLGNQILVSCQKNKFDATTVTAPVNVNTFACTFPDDRPAYGGSYFISIESAAKHKRTEQS